MKVLHFVHNYYGFSGASQQAHNIALNLKMYHPEIEQRFFTIDQKNNTNKSDEFIIYSTTTSLLKKCIVFISVVLKYKPDLVHFHGADFSLLIICKLFGIKIYWKTTLLSSDDFASLTKGKHGYLKKNLLRLIDVNNTLTQQIYKINSQYLSPLKLVTIPNGVDVPDEKKIEKKEKLALIVSAIIPRKSIIEGIKFFHSHLSNHGYTLYIIGPNNNKLEGFDNEYHKTCLSFSELNVKFVGELTHKETLEYFKKSQFLIHLAKYEGMPNVVLEAMAHSVFPIVSSMGGLANELIENNVTGFNVDIYGKFEISTFPPHNMQGRDFILRKNSFKVIVNETYSIYSNILLKNKEKPSQKLK
ncbi:glycosyltransferase family 4 protein [Xenorhabdus bovienii]|uniref:glycosyltransferase family 4 protein n=1 Tax=Xenorhabdus bovienii TaxID=40576 RepID=UPI003DA317D5